MGKSTSSTICLTMFHVLQLCKEILEKRKYVIIRDWKMLQLLASSMYAVDVCINDKHVSCFQYLIQMKRSKVRDSTSNLNPGHWSIQYPDRLGVISGGFWTDSTSDLESICRWIEYWSMMQWMDGWNTVSNGTKTTVTWRESCIGRNRKHFEIRMFEQNRTTSSNWNHVGCFILT